MFGMTEAESLYKTFMFIIVSYLSAINGLQVAEFKVRLQSSAVESTAVVCSLRLHLPLQLANCRPCLSTYQTLRSETNLDSRTKFKINLLSLFTTKFLSIFITGCH